MIAKMPLVATVIVISLAFGIGVNTVVFSWIQAVVFRPIPGVEASGSVQLVEPRTETGMYPGMSWPEYQDLRTQVSSFRELLAFRMTPLYVGESGRVDRAYGLLVSANYFSALGLRPALGRFLRPEETSRAGDAPVVVISHDYWQTRLGGAPDALGRTLRVNSQELTIVGVAPPGFLGTVMRLQFDLWLPATLAPMILNGSRELERRTIRGYSVAGRLHPGATRLDAQSEIDAAMRELARTFPETNATVRAEVLPFWQSPRGPQRFLATALTFLQSLMLLLLLTVCGNTANLMLARASARHREMGLRLALGGGRATIVKLLLTENVLLALMGAALGLAVALWGTRTLAAMPLTLGFPIDLTTTVDRTGLAFAFGLGIACGVIFGLAPAVQLARIDPRRAIASGHQAGGRSLFRNALMAVQVALALIVLVAAGLFLRKFLETRDTDPGFRREGVLLAAYDLTGRGTDDGLARSFASRLLARLSALPSVEAVAIATSVPLDIHGLPSRVFTVDGWVRHDAGYDSALANTVTPAYFAVMGIPLEAGTTFADLQDLDAPPQVIVNRTFVRRYLKGLEPIGRRLQARGRDYVIAGVARDSLCDAFGEPPTPLIYFSFRDSPARGGEIHLRTWPGSEAALTPQIRQIVKELDPDLPVYNVRTMTDHVETNLLFRRVPARMFVVLGPMLLVLAAIGIYGVVAYNVSQRTIEVGVRLALGATPARVIVEFMSESLGIILLGVLAGWLIAFVFAPQIVGPAIDLSIFLGVPILLMLVSAGACWIPARRAAGLEPTVALRHN
jgi:macrolide transport system ATP-binding/permease protein